MRCELPEFARCCFCFPLRFGLLAWAYTKLICSLLLFTLVFESVSMGYRRGIHIEAYSLFPFICAHILLLAIIIDAAFLIMFIIAAHTKEIKKMKMFYTESICALVFYVIAFIIFICFLFVVYQYFALLIISLIWAYSFWIIVMQAYVVILVRSEVLKLERTMNYQFVNHPAPAVEDKAVLAAIDA